MSEVAGMIAGAAVESSIREMADVPTTVDAQATVRLDHALPSFLVIGPPRTGTTWLHEVLNAHADLPGPTKETRFFDLHYDRGLSWYLDHFPNTGDGRLVGEVAPTYFASDLAPERIAGTLPDAKLIIIFRHPVQRLVSLYRMKRAYGMFAGSLEDALEQDPELLSSSKYATHLRIWQGHFPPSQLSVNLYEDLSKNPQGFIDRLNDFLQIPRFTLQKAQMGQVFSSGEMTLPRSHLATRMGTAFAEWCKARKLDNVVASVRNSALIKLFIGGGGPFPDFSAETLRHISDMLRPEIEDLEKMLGCDLTHWKTPPAS